MPDNPAKIATSCPHCGKRFNVASNLVGRRAKCNACHQQFVIAQAQQPQTNPVVQPVVEPAAQSVTEAIVEPAAETVNEEGIESVVAAESVEGPPCVVCQSEVLEEEDFLCSDCGAHYHKECWEYNKGCGVYGCASAAETEGLNTLEVPSSHWGAEDKKCPQCGEVIMAAAVRCRRCGATFSSAAPQGRQAFREKQRTKSELPGIRKISIWLLVFSIIPCTAPIAAVVGLLWYLANRKAIRSLPALNAGLCKIAVGVAWIQVVLFVLFGVLNTIMNG